MGELLDHLQELVTAGCENIRQDIDLDGDWDAILFMANHEKGEKACTIVPFGHLMEDEESKEILGNELIPDLIEKHDAEAFAILVSAWALEIDNKTLDGEALEVGDENLIDALVPPSQHPQRKEVLVIMMADKKTECFLHAEIKRPEGAEHPELTEWSQDWGKEAKGHQGRFWDAPLAALRGES